MKKEGGLGHINWGRVLLGGLVTASVWTLLSMTLLAFVGGDLMDMVPGGRLYAPRGALQAYLLFVNLAMGLWAVFLYAAIRPRFGPGPKTAAVAGFAWWFIATLQSSKWVALGFTALKPALTLAAASLPGVILAVLAGAWLYEE